MNIFKDVEPRTGKVIIAVFILLGGAVGSFWWPIGTIVGAVLGAAIGYGFVCLLASAIKIQ